MTPGQRRWIFLVAGIGFVAFFLWGLSGLPGFGNYPGPYGPAILRVAVARNEQGAAGISHAALRQRAQRQAHLAHNLGPHVKRRIGVRPF